MEIFQDDDDRQIFLILLKKTLEKNECMLHAFCLMTNHVHLLLETGEKEVGLVMKELCGKYAQYYNRKYHYKGHVFEDRFKSCIVRDDSYFLQTSRYIHMNPVKARMVYRPEDYPWSSYRTMIGIADDRVTSVEKTLAYFKGNRMAYQQFVEDERNRYAISESEIHRLIEGDEEWLPW